MVRVQIMTTNSTPNVLFIMADQMKASILRMYSAQIGIETPTLERLAEEGVRFAPTVRSGSNIDDDGAISAFDRLQT